MKAFKQAYVDLKAMAKGALARGEKALEAAKKAKEAEKQLTSDSKAAAQSIQDARRRKQGAAVQVDFFTSCHSAAEEIFSTPLDSAMKLMIEGSEGAAGPLLQNSKVPQIVRFPSKFADQAEIKTDWDACRKSFTDSAAKATTGRATRSVSEDCAGRELSLKVVGFGRSSFQVWVGTLDVGCFLSC
jgi:hypothetical protein